MMPRSRKIKALISDVASQIFRRELKSTKDPVAVPRVKRIVPSVMFEIRDDCAHCGVGQTLSRYDAIDLGCIQNLVIISDTHVGRRRPEKFMAAETAPKLFTS